MSTRSKSRVVALSTSVVVVAVVAIVLWDRGVGDGSRDPRSVHESKPSAQSDAVTVDLPHDRTSATEPNPTPAERELVAEPASATEANSKPTPEVPDEVAARVTGRFLLPDGSPAVGVALKLHGLSASEERLLKYGNPAHWTNPETQTDSQGRFSLRFEPPRAFQFWLSAKLEHYGEVSWRQNEVAAGTDVDLGDVTLRRAGTIHGHVVDGRGQAIQGPDWRVYAEGPPGAEGAEETSVSKLADPATAEFTLEDVPSGHLKLRADSHLTNWIDGPEVDVAADQVLEADVVYSGADLSKRIMLSPHSRFWELLFLFGETMQPPTLRGPADERRPFSEIPNRFEWVVDGLAPGRYVAEFGDPRYLPWRMEVESGQAVRMELVGNAAVKLNVVDAKTGSEVTNCSVAVRVDQASCSPNTFPLLGEGDAMPEDRTLTGLVPIRQTLLVKAKGYATCFIPLHPLEANRTTEVTARLIHGATLSGVVVDSRRSPVANGVVQLSEHVDVQRSNPLETNFDNLETWNPEPPSEVTSDANGHFEFVNVGVGRYDLVTKPKNLEVRIDDVKVEPETDKLEHLDLVLPSNGRVVGTLIGPTGADFSTFRVVVRHVDAASSSAPTPDDANGAASLPGLGLDADDSDKFTGAVHADGTFCVAPVLAGPASISLQLPDVEAPLDLAATLLSNAGGPTIELGRVSVAADVDTRVQYDVRDRFPGSLDVSVRIDGVLVKNAMVEVFRSRAVAPDDDAELPLATARLDGSERTSIGPVPTGTVDLVVHDLKGRWAVWLADPVTVESAKATRVDLTRKLVEGTISITNSETGLPAPHQDTSIGCKVGAVVRYALHAKSDAEGKLKLRLEPGHYLVSAMDGMDEELPLEWTAGGPEPATFAIGE